jgi:ABC-type proline/glycine betaine transport system substrate-binding protein
MLRSFLPRAVVGSAVVAVALVSAGCTKDVSPATTLPTPTTVSDKKFDFAAVGTQLDKSVASENLEGAGLVVLQNNHVALERLKLPKLGALMEAPGLIYDFWHQHTLLRRSELPEGIRYSALGAFNYNGDNH